MRLFQHLKQMPKALAALTIVFVCCGLICVFAAILPISGWKYKDQPITYGELWQSGGGILVVSIGMFLILLAIGFYKAQRWVRYAVPLGIAALTSCSLIWPDSTVPYEWAGSLFWLILSCWYFFRKPKVVNYFSPSSDA